MYVDGSEGEGGGQVLRTSLSLSALTGRPLHMTRIRAGRSRPGLRPQHLTAVRAVAAICDAVVEGDAIDSQELTFRPGAPPKHGEYRFDVMDHAPHGSAGAATLILQAVLWPLAFTDSSSKLVLRGGTHVPFSPSFHYAAEVAQPAFERMGVALMLELKEWGWMPKGMGEIEATVRPSARLKAESFARVPPDKVQGIAAVTNLPAHIPHRMARRAENLVREAGLSARVRAVRETGAGPGAGIFLWVQQAGFGSLGRPGLPSERVAESAVADLLAFVDNESAAVDPFLADQLLLPMALAHGQSELTTNRITHHALTNIALLERWLGLNIHVQGDEGQPGRITVDGVGFART